MQESAKKQKIAMRKTVIFCDHCGKQIEGTVKVRDKDYNYFVATDGQKHYSDVCMECGSKLLWKTFYRPLPPWIKPTTPSVSTTNVELQRMTEL